MKSEKDKVLKVMNELVCFFFSLDIDSPRITINKLETHTSIYVEGYYPKPDIKKLERFSELVSTSRQDDYDEYYWNLAGSSHYPEYILLGSLTDTVDIAHENDILKIVVTRKFH